MSSSDHVADDTGAMAPCLRAICDNLNTSLTSEAIAKSRECGQFSYLDVLGEFVKATDFVERGEDVRAYGYQVAALCIEFKML